MMAFLWPLLPSARDQPLLLKGLQKMEKKRRFNSAEKCRKWAGAYGAAGLTDRSGQTSDPSGLAVQIGALQKKRTREFFFKYQYDKKSRRHCSFIHSDNCCKR